VTTDFLDAPPADEMGPLLMADESGESLPPNSCPECAAEGVTNSYKTAGGLGSHRKNAHGVEGKAEHKRPGKSKSSGPPRDVNINVNTGAKPKGKNAKDTAKLAQTAKGATSFANFAATGLVLMNQAEDADDIAKNAEAFGAAIGDLAQYQPWLSTVFAPSGEMTGEVAAWLGVTFVVAAMVIPIGARHGWVPEKYAAAFGVAMSAPTMAAAAADDARTD
jgi:hypothetical protein